jgi:predicted Zn-dependent protease
MGRSRFRVPVALGLAALAGCATSPLGRQRLLLFPDAEIAELGIASFDKMKREMPLARDAALESGARCVARALVAQVGAGGPRAWEVAVFRDDNPNAFALPGGKIGVNTGLFRVARNQDQLATVLGHEVAHVVAQHANERVSTAFAAQSGLELVQAITGAPGPEQGQLLALLGLGAQIGILLPYGRDQEREADLLGLDLMADAGFDPRESIALWKNMAAVGGAQPPEFLSTHPSYGTRMQDLAQRMPQALARSEEARRRGLRPACAVGGS